MSRRGPCIILPVILPLNLPLNSDGEVKDESMTRRTVTLPSAGACSDVPTAFYIDSQILSPMGACDRHHAVRHLGHYVLGITPHSGITSWGDITSWALRPFLGIHPISGIAIQPPWTLCPGHCVPSYGHYVLDMTSHFRHHAPSWTLRSSLYGHYVPLLSGHCATS